MSAAEEFSWWAYVLAMVTAPPRQRPSKMRYVIDGTDVSYEELRRAVFADEVRPTGDWVSGGPHPVNYFTRRWTR